MKTNCALILETEKNTSFFFKIYRGGQFFLWGTNTPVFGLLMTCALGFKARVDPLAHVLCHLVHNGILRFTSGATPAELLVASMAAKPFSSTYLQTSISGA